MNDGVLVAGQGPNELIFHINGDEHFSDMMHTHRLLGGEECVHLYPNHKYDPETAAKAFKMGFIVNEEDCSTPSANAVVSASRLSVSVFDYRSQSNWVTPYAWACQVAAGQRDKAPLKPCKKEEVL
ncbi:MAG: hypothetical protein JXQ82_07810 [Methanomicrobiaceae archaeon]|nr:hypothetical protein [Methanomicrobiaceae archaeon]